MILGLISLSRSQLTPNLAETPERELSKKYQLFLLNPIGSLFHYLYLSLMSRSFYFVETNLAKAFALMEIWTELTNGFFTRRGLRDSRFVQDIAHCLRFGKSVTNQAQYDTPGSPLMCLPTCDPWLPAVVFLPQPIAV